MNARHRSRSPGSGRRIPALLSCVAFLVFALLFSPGTVRAQGQAPEVPAELEAVRSALEKYRDPYAAVTDLYLSTVGCVEYPEGGKPGHVDYAPGGMGVHFLNGPLLTDGELDPEKPEVLVYDRTSEGELRLVAAEWMVPAGPETERPELFGQPFEGPMEGHVPLMPHGFHHYDLHVWLWKDNPEGVFAPTNPELDCPDDGYTVQEEAPRIVGSPPGQ